MGIPFSHRASPAVPASCWSMTNSPCRASLTQRKSFLPFSAAPISIPGGSPTPAIARTCLLYRPSLLPGGLDPISTSLQLNYPDTSDREAGVGNRKRYQYLGPPSLGIPPCPTGFAGRGQLVHFNFKTRCGSQTPLWANLNQRSSITADPAGHLKKGPASKAMSIAWVLLPGYGVQPFLTTYRHSPMSSGVMG